MTPDKNQEKTVTITKRKGPKAALVIVGVVLALFAILTAKSVAGSGSPRADTAVPGAPAASAPGNADSLTTVHNDAGADYEAALKTGKPIYLLFHSLTCDPCVEISRIADKVVPAYKDKVAFVNAITDDQSAQRLATKFPFQYIPTSFFLKPDGTVADSFTGVLSDAEMKARLDKLISQ